MSQSKRTERDSEPTDTKVVGVKDNEGTFHCVVMTRVNGNAYNAMQKKGFRDTKIFFMVVDAGVVAAHYDPRMLRQESPFIGRNDTSYEFMVALHDGVISWHKVPDGATVDPVALDEMKDG